MTLYKYQRDNWREEIERIYGCSFLELEAEFLNDINSRKYSEQEIDVAKKKLGLQ